MRISFKSISIENFMSIGKVDINFDNYKGYNVVMGENHNLTDNARSNGSGKSSIFEAIVWSLTGETIRGNKDVANYNGSDGALVDIVFDIDTHTYRIVRTKEHSKYKNNLFIYIDGEDKSGKGIRDTEKLLQQYLPELTASLIGSVIILGQGLPSRFTNNSPSARKEVLETLTRSDFMIDDLKTRISARKGELNSDLRSAQDGLLELKTRSNTTSNRIKEVQGKLSTLGTNEELTQELASVSSQLLSIIEQLELLNGRATTLNENKDQMQSQYSRLEAEYNAKISDLFNQHTLESSEVNADIKILQQQIYTLEQKIRKDKSVTDICPTCGQKLPDVYVPDTTKDEQELAALRSKLSELSVRNEQLYQKYKVIGRQEIDNQYQHQLRLVKDTLCNYLREIKDVSDQTSTLTRDRSSVDERKRSLENTIAVFDVQKRSLEDELVKLNNELQTLADKQKVQGEYEDSVKERLAIISKFETVIKRDFRGYLLQDIIVYIDKRAKLYCKDVFDTELIDFVLDGNNISITYSGKPYEALSGGERQKVDLIIQFAIRDMLCAYTGFSTNIIALDEIFDNLDDVGSTRVIDLISNKLSDISGVFIISHHAKELNIPYDNELVIVKNNDGVSYLA